MATNPRNWAETVMDLFFPLEERSIEGERLESPFCERCGEPFSGALASKFVCSNCLGRTWSLQTARAPYLARGEVREAIHGFKYQQEFHLLGPLSDWLEEGFERFFEGKKWSALVPVPLYPLKMRERGFNQAGELARALGRRKGIPVLEALNRVRSTSIQARLRRSERLRNQRGAFACKKGFDGKGMRLLIIDDVFTTGATVDACARALVKAGAEEVHALTVARG